jgi:hypothetical protein
MALFSPEKRQNVNLVSFKSREIKGSVSVLIDRYVYTYSRNKKSAPKDALFIPLKALLPQWL